MTLKDLEKELLSLQAEAKKLWPSHTIEVDRDFARNGGGGFHCASCGEPTDNCGDSCSLDHLECWEKHLQQIIIARPESREE